MVPTGTQVGFASTPVRLPALSTFHFACGSSYKLPRFPKSNSSCARLKGRYNELARVCLALPLPGYVYCKMGTVLPAHPPSLLSSPFSFFLPSSHPRTLKHKVVFEGRDEWEEHRGCVGWGSNSRWGFHGGSMPFHVCETHRVSSSRPSPRVSCGLWVVVPC